MSDERSKISLRSGPKRKGRPQISAPRQISGPIPQDGPGLALRVPGKSVADQTPLPRPRPPPQGASKTSDLVKRRYSTRFGTFPPDLDVNNPPPIPTLPPFNRFDSTPPRDKRPPPSRGGAAPPVVNLQVLRDPNLNADQYAASALGDATEDEIRDFEVQLKTLKSRAAGDLQANVYQNRTQFIKISKEAEKLKGEMRALKTLMADLKTNAAALRTTSTSSNQADGGGFSSGMSKRDKRSSVMDRSLLWQSQIQALYKNVEGSQKFLPNAPGRHLVQDAGAWIELDNATYKSRRLMNIYLLNDHLLIVSRRKRRGDTAAMDGRAPVIKLVADRCWPLMDIEVIDMAGTSESSGRTKLADAIMVRGVGQESVIYRTEKPEDSEKKSLMLNIRKAVEELRRGVQMELDANNKARETINFFASRDPGLLKTELLPDLTNIKDAPIEVDGTQQNVRWVESQMDELDIDIALQRLEPAVTKVEKMQSVGKQQRNATVQKLILFKVGERASKLAALITRRLVDAHNDQKKTKSNVQWLSRLGFEDGAKAAYLEARSALIQQRTRQCIFQGDLHLYIWQISFVYFTIIRNTVTSFQSCFPQAMMSACVKWAKEQVEAFNVILGRQLSSTDKGSTAWMQCMERSKEHAKMLSEVGLDFSNLVGHGIENAAARNSAASPVGLGLQ
ncbi:uncharacterized protein MKZ38_005522 [Zalerion maritima]|uniref:Exocyst complex component EXO84 n=1 Tax=Zalerion maritima TaxID=339359 RepID=A0AAD5RY11_9PEZI|nr:uncharacterized protein MKZ38_005522 [Zalerion maritima]